MNNLIVLSYFIAYVAYAIEVENFFITEETKAIDVRSNKMKEHSKDYKRTKEFEWMNTITQSKHYELKEKGQTCRKISF